MLLFNSYWGVGEGTTPFPELLHFTLDPYLIILSVKQGGIKYHFSSLWKDSTWDWTPVIYIFVCVCASIYLYIYIYIICLCVHLYIYVYIYIYMSVIMCVWICVWIYIYVCVCVCIRTMHQSITPSLSQTIWPKWVSRQFLSLPMVQTLLPVTFGYSQSSEPVVMRHLRRWKRLWRRWLTRSHKKTSIGPFRSCWNGTTSSWRRLHRRGLEFHVCIINKSAHTKKSGNLSNDPCMYIYGCVCVCIYIYIYIYICAYM